MYQVNILTPDGWKYFDQCYSKYELDLIVREIMQKLPNKAMQILEDNKVLIILNGSQYQYFYFKNKFINEVSNEFDYIKQYKKTR